MSPPGVSDFVKQLWEADAFTVSVRGFAGIEATMDLLLSEALPVSESFEADRITPALKIALVVALGLLAPEHASALRRLARVRNAYAHDFVATFDDTGRSDLLNTLSASHRSSLEDHELASGTAENALRWVTYTLFAELVGAVRRRREKQLTDEVWREILHEEADRIRRSRANRLQEETGLDIRATEKMAARRQERGWHLRAEGHD